MNNLKKENFRKFYIDKTLFFFVTLISIYGFFAIWSASGSNNKIIEYKFIQILIGFSIMFITSNINPKVYKRFSVHLYILCIFLLILVDIFGQINKGAQRWLSLGFLHFQPSEIMKISVPLIIARYADIENNVLSLKNIGFIFLLILIPTILIAIQPDLGTSILIFISGLFTIFLIGISWKIILLLTITISSFVPFMWYFFMHDYQRKRLMILLNPQSDPMGSGYHIIQSKIAIGSGGLLGKGWLHGTQSQLKFLPERHTDFIFAVLGEEFGFIGVITLIFLYLGIVIRGLMMAMNTKSVFGRITIASLTFVLFTYVFVNIGMVTGILPVVGIPLPLVSYGGSSLVAWMSEFGIIISIFFHKKII